MSKFELKEEGVFKYIESGGKGDVLLLLHGLFGALSNFDGIINNFSEQYNVVVPVLPILELPIRTVSVTALVDHVQAFVEYKGFDKVHVLGNSLGGHVSLLYAMGNPGRIASVILTGSSGLFENSLGSTFPKRGNYEFIKNKTESTFYNPACATKELVDEVFNTVNDTGKAIRVVATAKSAVRHNLADKLHLISAPVLLVWGRQDNVTPAFVGEKFHELLSDSELHFIEECGHAPMMEKPNDFNVILADFLLRHQVSVAQ